MSCAARQWPTHRDLSKGMLVWVCVYSNKYPIAECERSELAPISRGSWAFEARKPRFKHSPSIISVVSGSKPPFPEGEEVDSRTGNGWVRVILLVFLWTSSNRTPEGWFARCDSSVHCRPLAARGVLFLILQFLSFSICFVFVLTYLLKRIKYKLIDK